MAQSTVTGTRLAEVARLVAVELGEGWTAIGVDPENRHLGELVDGPNGMQIRLCGPDGWRDGWRKESTQRLKVRGRFPRWTNGVKIPEITASLEREPSSIARDVVKKRFMPVYREAFAEMDRRWDEARAYEAKKQSVKDQLLATGFYMSSDYAPERLWSKSKKGHTLQVNSDGVRFEAFYCTVEQAIAIAKIMADPNEDPDDGD